MPLLKLTRYRICIFIACAFLPVFFLFPGQISHFSFSSFIPFSTTVSNDTILSPYPTPTPITNPSPELTEDITNNNATYPRLHFNHSHSLYAPQAKLFLDRLQSTRNLLFGGAVKDLNNEMMDRLITLLRRAESDENYVPPRVRGSRLLSSIHNLELTFQVVLTSWHWVPCAVGDCTTGEVQWIRPLVCLSCNVNWALNSLPTFARLR